MYDYYSEWQSTAYWVICLCCIRINFNCSSNTSRFSSAVVRSFVSSVSGSCGFGLLFLGCDDLGLLLLDDVVPTNVYSVSLLSSSSSELLAAVAPIGRLFGIPKLMMPPVSTKNNNYRLPISVQGVMDTPHTTPNTPKTNKQTNKQQ